MSLFKMFRRVNSWKRIMITIGLEHGKATSKAIEFYLSVH